MSGFPQVISISYSLTARIKHGQKSKTADSCTLLLAKNNTDDPEEVDLVVLYYHLRD